MTIGGAMHARRKLFLALSLAVGACATPSIVATEGEHYEARPEDWPVDVYLAETAPAKLWSKDFGYATRENVPPGSLRIGRVRAKGDRNSISYAPLIARCQKGARDLGGDAIVIVGGGFTGHEVPDLLATILRYSKSE